MLTTADQNEFRKLLQGLQRRVRGDYEHLTDEALEPHPDSRSPTHMAELGTDAYEQELTLRAAASDERILEAIQTALEKIDKGSYGLCEGCLAQGKPATRSMIPRRRLREIPYTPNCIKCERDAETRGKRRTDEPQ